MELLKGNAVNLNDTAYYNNRELSWLAFNERVLQEAQDANNPLFGKIEIY